MKVDPELIKRYCEENSTKAEREKLLSWFTDLECEKDLRHKYRTYWDELENPDEIENYNDAALLGNLYRQMHRESSLQGRRKLGTYRLVHYLTRIAAVLFIPLLVFALAGRDKIFRADSGIAYSKIYAPLGTRTMFSLPDGTTGSLNGGSTLEFPTEFRGPTRDIRLRGEAYFNVAENTGKPFVVSGSDYQVKVLGTSFNILGYPEDSVVRVTLVSGKLEVAARRNGTVQYLGMLQPEQMCEYDTRAASCRIRTADVNKVTAWKDGKLVFRDDPLGEVVQRINRWYNVDLFIRDHNLETHPYRATFQDESLEEVLKLLALSAPIGHRDLGRERHQDGSYGKRKVEIYYKKL